MKLTEVKGTAWQTWQVEGTPFRIEKIDRACYYVYRLWGTREIFLRQYRFASLAKASAHLEPIIEQYKSSIITAQL